MADSTANVCSKKDENGLLKMKRQISFVHSKSFMARPFSMLSDRAIPIAFYLCD
jgi:hypothetical protein